LLFQKAKRLVVLKITLVDAVLHSESLMLAGLCPSYKQANLADIKTVVN
jgi:hypothetical protein